VFVTQQPGIEFWITNLQTDIVSDGNLLTLNALCSFVRAFLPSSVITPLLKALVASSSTSSGEPNMIPVW